MLQQNEDSLKGICLREPEWFKCEWKLSSQTPRTNHPSSLIAQFLQMLKLRNSFRWHWHQQKNIRVDWAALRESGKHSPHLPWNRPCFPTLQSEHCTPVHFFCPPNMHLYFISIEIKNFFSSINSLIKKRIFAKILILSEVSFEEVLLRIAYESVGHKKNYFTSKEKFFLHCDFFFGYAF